MKTVSGVVLSLKPVSLSKAAKILSKFSAADNGATPAYAYYLNRASKSFDELVQLRKELHSEHKSKKHRSGVCNEAEEPVNLVCNYGEADEVKEIVKEPVKKKRKNTVDNGESTGASNGVRVENVLMTEEIGRNRNKKMKNGSVDEKKESKKRKREEIASGNGEASDSAKKLMQHKKSKSNVEN